MQTCVLTVSTSVARRQREDEAGPLLAELAEAAGLAVEAMEVIPDDAALIQDRLHHYVDDGYAVVLTTGGTGPAPDDLTPEATRVVIERPAPGLAEAIRAAALARTPLGALDRGVAGIAGRTLIINFPGDAQAVRDTFPAVAPTLQHAVRMLRPTDARDGG